MSFARRGMFASLRHRNFRLLWLSLFVSNCGTWLQLVAQDYLVYELTGRAFELGLVNGVRALALITLPFVGGALADRIDQRRLLVATQALFALSAFGLGALVATGLVRVWHVVAASFLTAVLLAFDQPARQALIPRLVPRSALTNAIALNAITFTGAAAVGPALAGPLVARFGLAWAFHLNALSYLAVIVGVALMRLTLAQAHGALAEPVGRSLASGARYVAASPAILYLAAMLALVSVLALPYQTLLPVFAVRGYGGDVETLGWLRAAVGVGALAGGVLFAHHSAGSAEAVSPRRAWGVLGAGALFSATLFLFTLASSLREGIALLLLSGASWTFFQSNTQTLLQHLVEDRMRGRVMSLFAVAVIGMWQLGAFPMGWSADHVGADRALQGATALAVTATFVLSFAMRRHIAAMREPPAAPSSDS